MRLFFLVGGLALILGGCSDDDSSGQNNNATPHDGAVRDAAPAPDGQIQPDSGAPGVDPCTGTAYTTTTPTTGQGVTPAGSTTAQQEAVQLVTGIRNQVGLNPINLHAAINQAAQAHAEYCTTDSSWCPGWHTEESGHPGFTGESFSDRMSTAGYTGSPLFEVMAPGSSPQSAIQMWLNSVYHRTPFLTPEAHEAGFGSDESYSVMDFGCCGSYDTDLVTNYPAHGQTGFPTSFSGNEGPQPPAPPGGFPSGPVISIVFPPNRVVGIVSHLLFDDTCTQIDHVAGGQDITPDPGFQPGFLRTQVVLYANDPLQSGETYTVSVEYTMGGTPGHRTFTFTTQ